MRRKLLFAPIILGAVFAFLTLGCEKEEQEVCQKFDLGEHCEIPNVCCPTGDGDCYIEYADQRFYCDKTKATPNDPYGCDDAENQAIEVLCVAASPEQLMAAKVELSKLTRKLMQEARTLSVSH